MPELAQIEDDGAEPDITIERGVLSANLPGGVCVEPHMQVAGDQFLLDAPAGRYAVRCGKSIVVEARPGASSRDLRLYLLGAVMGVVCHQRSLLPLHAMAVDLDGRAAAFAGPSGAGKSTLAAQFQSRGVAVLSDDLCAVKFDQDGRAPWVIPGLARIKLWGDSLGLIGLSSASLSPIADNIDKFSLGVPDVGSTRPRPLDRLYILRPDVSREVDVRLLSGPEAVGAAVANVHRWPVAVAMGQAPARFAQCLALASHCQIFEVAFTHDARKPFGLFEALERHWAL